MNYKKEFKIGLFVVVILVVSFFTINYLRGKDIFNREIQLSGRYDNLDGLVVSAPVYIKGYKAGKVVDVEYEPAAGDFLVTCSILKQFGVPVDSKMMVYAVDLMGTKGVRIDLGHSTDCAKDGDTLVTDSEASMLDELAGGVSPVLMKVGLLLDSLNVTVAGINNLLSDSNTESLSRTFAHIESTLKNLSSVSSVFEGKSAEFETFIDNLSELSSDFTVIAEKVDTTITDFSEFISSLDENQINEVVVSFNQFLKSLNDPEGSIGKLLTDKSVYDSVDELLNDVDILVKKIQENPRKYIKISVF